MGDDSEDDSPLTTIRVNQQVGAKSDYKAGVVNLLDDPVQSGIVNPINPFSDSNNQTPNINFDLLDGFDNPSTRFDTKIPSAQAGVATNTDLLDL